MGVDFFLYRRKRRRMPKSDIPLPEIEARFAFTEYLRFLSKLAKGAGIGEVWDNYKQAVSVLSEAQLERPFAELEGKQPETTNEMFCWVNHRRFPPTALPMIVWSLLLSSAASITIPFLEEVAP